MVSSPLRKSAAGNAYLPHEPPIYQPGQDNNDAPSHYKIPNENGYFPAAADGNNGGFVLSCEPVTLYQIHPRYYPHGSVQDFADGPLATGVLTLRDPDDGTAEEVALVGTCADIIFYVTVDDVVTKTRDTEFVLLLPKDCIVVDLGGVEDAEKIHAVMNVLAARMKFRDDTLVKKDANEKEIVYPEALPDDAASRVMYRASSTIASMIVEASKKGAEMIDDYGDKKRQNITETKEVKMGKGSKGLAKSARGASVEALSLVTKVSEKISDVVGSKVGKAAAIKEGDTEKKKKARTLLLASSIAYGEIADGASEGYEMVVKAAQDQATSFVATKYGEDAADVARHTAGATINFGRAALTARRVVNVKKIAKSAGKNMIKETIKSI